MRAVLEELDPLVEMDRAHLIHPVTSWALHEQRGATIIDSADGIWFRDIRGNLLLDAFAGLWCVNVGYGRKSMIEAAVRQMERLPYATGYFHYTSEAAIRLATRLCDLAPGNLDHVFFTLGGSDAVDTSIRLIHYYYNVLGRPQKKHMIALDKGYHGSSTVSSGLSGLQVFHTNFDVPTPLQHHIPAPYAYRSEAADDAALIAASVQQLRDKVAELGADNVAAFYCEPIQGSGGVITPPRGWLGAMRALCAELGILFVADEVITGFGRTGTLFACEQEGVVPDLMTLAKGLTAGYSPMGAVLLSAPFYRTIADNTPAGASIGHGLTYSGHPVSAAVGLEALRIYTEEGLVEHGARVGEYFQARLATLASHPLVGDVRGRGLLAGVELVTDKARKLKPAPELGFSERLTRAGYHNGLVFRAFADGVAGFAPPLICTESDVDTIVQRFAKTLDDVLNTREIRNAVD
ncbi:MAG: aminotransferase class III-fold pyridoxal phosphate-dependent enzyme [Pseudoxanthomonas sp.]